MKIGDDPFVAAFGYAFKISPRIASRVIAAFGYALPINLRNESRVIAFLLVFFLSFQRF